MKWEAEIASASGEAVSAASGNKHPGYGDNKEEPYKSSIAQLNKRLR